MRFISVWLSRFIPIGVLLFFLISQVYAFSSRGLWGAPPIREIRRRAPTLWFFLIPEGGGAQADITLA